MLEAHILKISSLLIGIVGLAIGLGIILIPRAVANLEKKLDQGVSTEKLEKILNEKRNLSELLLKNPKVFGSVLVVISCFLLWASISMF